MTSIHDLHSDTIEEILINSEPQDVAAFAQTSRTYRSLVYETIDDHLWRSLYLSQLLDDPRKCVSQNLTTRDPSSINWMKELQLIIRAKAVLDNPHKCRGKEERIRVLKTLLGLVENAPISSSLEFGAAEVSLNLLWVAAVIRPGTFLDQPELFPPSPQEEESIGNSSSEQPTSTEPLTGMITRSRAKALLIQALHEEDEEVQLRARLHAYYGLTNDDVKPSRRVDSRAYVYNMRKYGFHNRFGPFMPMPTGSDSTDIPAPIANGSNSSAIEPRVRVNWVHVEAIHHLMSMHVVNEHDIEDAQYIIYPLSLPFAQSYIAPDLDIDKLGREGGDWAGVQGRWRCSFCFCDHRELLMYNQINIPNPGMLSTALFESPDFQELFRSLLIDLSVSNVTPDPRWPTRPKINFLGEMGPEHVITGWVQMTEEGYIQWHFVSGEQGSVVWSSEGIQLGGIRSSFGVLGAWTTIFHDEDDPVGPFWLRKDPGDDV